MFVSWILSECSLEQVRHGIKLFSVVLDKFIEKFLRRSKLHALIDADSPEFFVSSDNIGSPAAQRGRDDRIVFAVGCDSAHIGGNWD